MTARANYIIAAQDATKDAIRSIQSNFKSLDSGIKSTARGINLALGFLAGAGLKNLFRNALDATAEAAGKNSEFAQTLDDVRKSARDLMVPKTGLPGVTDNLKDLAATLKDPAVVSAADALFSSLLRGGTAAVNVLAQTAAGIRVLATQKGGDQQVDLDTKIQELQKLMRGYDSNPRNSVAAAARADLQQKIDALQRSYDLIAGMRGSFGGDRLSSLANPASASAAIDAQVSAMDAAEAAVKEYQDTVKELQKTLEQLPGEFAETASANVQETLKAQQETSEAAAKFFEETQERGKELAARGAEMTRKMFDEQTEYARQAARNMQDALATFLFDPFHDGLKGMLRGFVDTIRKMVAEAAAAKIFDSKDKGGLGLGDAVFKGIGSLFGFADGGSFKVGGSGGVDSQLVAFRASPNETVTVTKPGQGGGGLMYAPVYNIDARGASMDLARALPGILAQASKATETRIIQGLRNGRYD